MCYNYYGDYMDMNPKLIKIIVIMFAVLFEIYNIKQIFSGNNVIIHIIFAVIIAAGYFIYNKFYKGNEGKDDF